MAGIVLSPLGVPSFYLIDPLLFHFIDIEDKMKSSDLFGVMWPMSVQSGI